MSALGRFRETTPGAAAAAVLAAWCGADREEVAGLVAAAQGDDAILRWVAETDVAVIHRGRGGDREGRWLATRLDEQRSEWHATLADALAWAVGGGQWR